MGEYGYEPIDDGFELDRPIDSAELIEARIIVAAALRPCSAMTIKRELARLHLLTASREPSQDGGAMKLALYAEMLAPFPEDIVVTVCRDWLNGPKGEFWPAWAELGAPADRLVEERRNLAQALARGPARPREPDPEDRERRRLVTERNRQWAEAAAWRRAHPDVTTARAPRPERIGDNKPLPPLPPHHLPDVADLPEAQRWLAEMEAAS